MKKRLPVYLVGIATTLLFGFFAIDVVQAAPIQSEDGFADIAFQPSGDSEDAFEVQDGKRQDNKSKAGSKSEGGKFGGMSGGKSGPGAPSGGVGGKFGGMGGGMGGPGGPGGGGAGMGMGGQGNEFGGPAGMGGMGMGGPVRVKLVLQMYTVGDLLTQSKHSPFSGFTLPGLGSSPSQGFGGGMGGGFGGGPRGTGGVYSIPPAKFQGLGGMGGGGGMGGVSRPSSDRSKVVSTGQLSDVIMSSVAANSWDMNGGVGTISFLNDLMVVNQTEGIHEQIKTFLKMVRSNTPKKPTITIKAIWLDIDEDLFQSLDIEADQQVNSKVLAQLVKSHGRRAQVTCFDGDIAHIAAGNLKNSIESVVPVVGQNELKPNAVVRIANLSEKKNRQPVPSFVMAQSLGGDELGIGNNRASNVGYSPISRWINYGAVLQVQPKVDPDLKMLTLSVSSVLVSRPKRIASTTYGAANRIQFGVDLEKHDLQSQQFQSNLRLKNATPTLVGGAAFQSESNSDQMYLIIEAIVNND